MRACARVCARACVRACMKANVWRTRPNLTCSGLLYIAQSCANHMQQIERLSRATYLVTCHVVRRDSSAVKFDRIEIAVSLALFYWMYH